MTIHFETSDYKDENYKGHESVVTDENGNEIGRFTHNIYHDRAHWANGFFTALKLK